MVVCISVISGAGVVVVVEGAGGQFQVNSDRAALMLTIPACFL